MLAAASKFKTPRTLIGYVLRVHLAFFLCVTGAISLAKAGYSMAGVFMMAALSIYLVYESVRYMRELRLRAHKHPLPSR